MANTIAITGANGYLGGTIAAHLSKQGWHVKHFVRVPRNKNDVRFTLGENITSAQFKGIHVLVHCAYDFHPRSWEEISRVNVEGTLNLFRASKAAGIYIIFISSLSAYQGCKSMYGKAKLAVEQEGIADVIIRPGLVFSKDPGSMVWKLKQAVQHHTIIPMVAKIDKPLYLCHAQDVAYSVGFFCSKRKKLRKPVIAASQQSVRFRTMLETLAGRKLFFVPVPYCLVLWCMKLLELLHIPFPFRSDSLISLANQNPKVDFGETKRLKLRFREFSAKTIDT